MSYATARESFSESSVYHTARESISGESVTTLISDQDMKQLESDVESVFSAVPGDREYSEPPDDRTPVRSRESTPVNMMYNNITEIDPIPHPEMENKTEIFTTVSPDVSEKDSESYHVKISANFPSLPEKYREICHEEVLADPAPSSAKQGGEIYLEEVQITRSPDVPKVGTIEAIEESSTRVENLPSTFDQHTTETLKRGGSVVLRTSDLIHSQYPDIGLFSDTEISSSLAFVDQTSTTNRDSPIRKSSIASSSADVPSIIGSEIESKDHCEDTLDCQLTSPVKEVQPIQPVQPLQQTHVQGFSIQTLKEGVLQVTVPPQLPKYIETLTESTYVTSEATEKADDQQHFTVAVLKQNIAVRGSPPLPDELLFSTGPIERLTDVAPADELSFIPVENAPEIESYSKCIEATLQDMLCNMQNIREESGLINEPDCPISSPTEVRFRLSENTLEDLAITTPVDRATVENMLDYYTSPKMARKAPPPRQQDETERTTHYDESDVITTETPTATTTDETLPYPGEFLRRFIAERDRVRGHLTRRPLGVIINPDSPEFIQQMAAVVQEESVMQHFKDDQEFLSQRAPFHSDSSLQDHGHAEEIFRFGAKNFGDESDEYHLPESSYIAQEHYTYEGLPQYQFEYTGAHELMRSYKDYEIDSSSSYGK